MLVLGKAKGRPCNINETKILKAYAKLRPISLLKKKDLLNNNNKADVIPEPLKTEVTKVPNPRYHAGITAVDRTIYFVAVSTTTPCSTTYDGHRTLRHRSRSMDHGRKVSAKTLLSEKADATSNE
nr:unnamed protein product [Callosobruchus analis]